MRELWWVIIGDMPGLLVVRLLDGWRQGHTEVQRDIIPRPQPKAREGERA
jgi:hypothetical protein